MLEPQAAILPMVGDGSRCARSSRARPPAFGASDDFNSGALVVFLKPWERARGDDAGRGRARSTRKLAQLPAVRGNAQVRSSLGGGRGQPINFVIAGPTYEGLAARARPDPRPRLADNPGIVNLDSDYKETKPQLRIDVDTTRAGDLGVSVDDGQPGAAEPARIAARVDLSRSRRGISRHRPGRGRAGARRRHDLCDDLCAQPRRRAGAAVEPRHGARDGGRRAISAASTSCARSRSRAGLAPGYSLGDALDVPRDRRRRTRPRSPRSAIAAKARRSRRPAARS